MSSFNQNFLTFIESNALFQRADTLIVGVSGGVDSMVLAELLWTNGYKIVMAHVNFQLRGQEADGDAAFVQNFAEAKDIPCHVHHVDTKNYAKVNKLSIQEAARAIRYQWFEDLRQSLKAVAIVVGHHKDDVAETMLINLTRGTGIAGLHGILPKNGVVVRPLLFAERSMILAYAKKNDLDWRADSSNDNTKYARNLIRHKVIPLLESINPSVVKNIVNTSLIMNDLELVLEGYFQNLKTQFVIQDADKISIDLGHISKLPGASSILYHLIREYGFNASQIADILASQTSSKVFLSNQKRAVIHGEKLIISNFAEANVIEYLLEPSCEEPIKTPDFTLSWGEESYHGQALEKDEHVAYLDQEQLVFPLVLRKRRAGDWFQPIGMNGKSKKLKKYLSDLKLSVLDKEQLWILENGDGQICWVVGMRLDHRFRVSGRSRFVLKMTWIPN